MNGYEALKFIVEGGKVRAKEGDVYSFMTSIESVYNETKNATVYLKSFLNRDSYEGVGFRVKIDINFEVIFISDFAVNFEEAFDYAQTKGGRLPSQVELIYSLKNINVSGGSCFWTCHQDVNSKKGKSALVGITPQKGVETECSFEYSDKNEKNLFIVIKDLT